MTRKNLTYCHKDFWVERAGTLCRIGLSGDAVKKLGKTTLVDLPMEGEIKTGEPFLQVVTSKVACEMASPITGTIRKVNDALLETHGIDETNWIAVVELEGE